MLVMSKYWDDMALQDSSVHRYGRTPYSEIMPRQACATGA
jgi:hypothetical protein